VERQVVGLLCRTSDRAAGVAAGTRELAELLDARIVGSEGAPRTSGWEDDLRDSHGCLLEAGGQLDDALEAGRMPILLSAECSIAVSTLPVLVRLGKDAMFRTQDMALDDALDFLRAQLTIAFSTEDIQEGVKAFFEKREPQWTGR